MRRRDARKAAAVMFYCGLIQANWNSLAPFFHLGSDQLAEFGRRHRHRDAAKVFDAFLERGVQPARR